MPRRKRPDSPRCARLRRGDTNGSVDVFVRNRSTGRTRRVNVSTTGVQAQGPAFRGTISADGRFVTFHSAAPNMVDGDTNGDSDVFVRGPLQ
jgi:hypothetical protein